MKPLLLLALAVSVPVALYFYCARPVDTTDARDITLTRETPLTVGDMKDGDTRCGTVYVSASGKPMMWPLVRLQTCLPLNDTITRRDGKYYARISALHSLTHWSRQSGFELNESIIPVLIEGGR